MNDTMNDTLIDAARAITGHGFADDQLGDLSTDSVAYDLVTMSAATLLNVGENTLSRRFRAMHGDDTMVVILRSWDDGTADLMATAPDEPRSRELIEGMWEEMTDADSYEDEE